MSAQAARKPRAIEETRLPARLIEDWLLEHRIRWEQIERGAAVWPTSSGRVALTVDDIERMIAAKDPVAWAWLNLVERKTFEVDGVIGAVAGAPWRLFPVQAEMARLKGDLIVECGSEVGKTRDIVLGVLWEVDTARGPGSALIGGDSDQTLMPIWEEIEFQLDENPRIGGGLVESRCHIKPNRKKAFVNGSDIELRLTGQMGKNFRGGHFSRSIRADEAVKWTHEQQWSEFWRSALPGAVARIYSTPDGNYSSPFYAMCARAVPVNGPRENVAAPEALPQIEGTRRFRKFHISKKQLPAPFWSEKRAAIFREQFGGEHSVGWITNVEGRWGSPTYSVFPMPTLQPNLKYLPHYRLVTATIDRETRSVAFAAARLASEVETVDGSRCEEQLARGRMPVISGKELGVEIARYFPPMLDWTSPKLFCGADLGSAQDPSEYIFVREAGEIWIDVFRLHLRNADWPEQADIVAQLDHASGHRVVYSFDNGSAGSALIQALTQDEARRECPVCAAAVYFSERLSGRGFGERVDEIDIQTGRPVLNPDDRDAAGNLRPYRVSNKEFSTRILERKAQARQLQIAWDGGAGDQRLSGPQLLVNHTAIGISMKHERKFRAENDHHVDARRQVALAIVDGVRKDGFVSADPAVVATSPREGASALIDVGARGSIAAAFGVRSVGRGLGAGW